MKKRTKKTLSIAVKVFIRLLLASVLCAILYVSMNVISTAFFSNIVGYQIFEQNENGEVNMVVEHYYQSGDPIQTADTIELADNQMFSAIRVVPPGAQKTMNVISQVLMLIVLGVFPYHILWEFGNRDDTNVRYRGQRPDPLRGAKIGLLAISPFAVSLVVLLLSKYIVPLGNYLAIYRVTAFPYLPYVNWLLGDAASAAAVSIWRLLLLIPTLFFVPLVCSVAYRMGGRQFSIAEFITFSKKAEDHPMDEEI